MLLRAFRDALRRQDLLPSLRLAAWAVALFGAGLALAQWLAPTLRELLGAQVLAGMAAFVASSVLAVLMPLASNLPLVPLAVLAWGPWATAALLLAGWVIGSAASFALGRYAQRWVSRRLPAVLRHASIDRLIDPRRRLLSLVLLRMTFPVDLLSYALGLFSRQTTLAQTMLSTLIGGAPFALLFALLPALPLAAQGMLLAGSTLLFVAYLRWMPRGDATR